MTRTLLLCAILALGTTAATARIRQPSAEDEVQAACYPDVQRLCRDALPDEGKVRACMEGHRSQISAKCLKAYKKNHG